MTTEIKLPSLGEGVDEADVLDVLVSEGDVIEVEQGILEVETDKASAEIPATKAGRVEKIHVAAGDSIRVGHVLLTLSDRERDDDKTDDKGDKKRKRRERPTKSERPEGAKAADETSQPIAEEKEGTTDSEAEESAAASVDKESSEATSELTETDDERETSNTLVAASPAVRRYAR
ncbi:MAG: biotin/lipoyl-containing protein [Planctomycetota bacterium]